MKLFRNAAAALLLGALLAAPSAVTAQTWTSWNTAWFGTLGSSSVSWTGPSTGGQLTGAGGIDYWAGGAYTQGGLTNPDVGNNYAFIQEVGPFSGTIDFGQAVVNPYIAWISVGQGGTPVDLNFGGAAFTVLSNNNTICPYWGCGSYTATSTDLTGVEFSGTIQFLGTFSSLSISTKDNEDWYGFSVGADAVANSVVPEPASLTLLSTGLVGLFGAGLRRRRRA